MERRSGSRPQARASSWGWFVVAVLLLFFWNGRWIVPAASWWAPVFLLRFVRTQRLTAGCVAGLLASIVVTLITWKGMIPVPGALYLVIGGVIGVLSFLPYAIDRLIAPRIEGFASTLVLPLAWTSVDWLGTALGPYGSWGSVAYTQADNLPLLQLLSVTGLWGVVFLMAWSAAVVNWAWERQFEWRRVGGGIALYAAIASLVFLAGGLRLALTPPRSPSLRVAGLTVRASPGPLSSVMSARWTPDDLEAVRRSTGALHDTLLMRSEREARAGARLVLWSEANGAVLKQDESDLIQRGRELARAERIWLLMALAVATPGKPRYENELVAVRPDGSVAFRYHKAHPVPGDPETGADARIPAPIATPFGRVTGAICFDMDFPALIRQAGRDRADILFAPSSDWAEIVPIHTRMAIFRGIENGCSVVRQTNKGLSAAADYQGRILAATDYFRTPEHIMVAQVPTRGVRTIYARVGDLFAWGSLAGLLAIAGLSVLMPAPRR